jgi:hypothetical protein
MHLPESNIPVKLTPPPFLKVWTTLAASDLNGEVIQDGPHTINLAI